MKKKVWSILTHQRLQLFLGLFNKVIVSFPNGKFAIWGIYSDFFKFFGDPLSKSKYCGNLFNHISSSCAAQMLQVLRNLGCFQRYARPARAAARPNSGVRNVWWWHEGLDALWQGVKMSSTIEDPNIGVSMNGYTPKWIVIMEHPIKMGENWGGTPISGNLNITVVILLVSLPLVRTFPLVHVSSHAGLFNSPIPVCKIPSLFCTFAHMVGTTKFYRFS